MPLREELTVDSDMVCANAPMLDDVPTDYVVVLGYHHYPADFPSTLKPIYDSADVVLHEQIGWQQDEVRMYNQLSFATERNHAAIIDEFRRRHFGVPLSMKRGRLIDGSRARHGFWDIEHSDSRLDRIVTGRHSRLSSEKEVERLTDTIIESDIIALKALKDRISSVAQKPYKDIRRKVVLHAGLAHVLLFNGLRHAAEQTSHSSTTLHMPFDSDNSAVLAEQDPSVAITLGRVAGRSSRDQIAEAVEIYRLAESGAVRPKVTHEFFKDVLALAESNKST